jgi:hypothetical protein
MLRAWKQGEKPMRSVFAFILGIAVTVGGTYMRDTYYTDPAAKPLVNWPEVADSSRATLDFARAQWDRLTR